MVIALGCIVGFVGYFIWKAQQDSQNSFDVFDLLMDDLPNDRRKASVIKTTFMSAFIISSWVVIDQEIKLKLTEGVFGLYMGTWCASLIAKVVFDKQSVPKLFGDKNDGDH
jgi:hypothetical protein